MPGLKIGALMRASWTVRGPVRVLGPDGGEHWELRVDELPDFLVAAATREEALNEYLPALQAFLESYLDAGEQPPLPIQQVWSFRTIGYFGKSRPPGSWHGQVVVKRATEAVTS